MNEWSARLPTMLSVLITALMVQAVTRHYAGLNASLFAALAFIFGICSEKIASGPVCGATKPILTVFVAAAA
jgi:4-amino-4-deoxy-L-arabinose transferase-like glycosyltransferase